MKLIYKYYLPIKDHQNLEIPRGYKLLSCQEQRGQICVWVMIEPEQPKDMVDFFMVGDGNDIPNLLERNMQHLATIQLGNSAWHVFTRMET